MKFIPILFSTEMVKAILDGRKTMTRMVVKHKALLSCLNNPSEQGIDGPELICPYGQPGDVLWVRERWNHIVNEFGEHIGFYHSTDTDLNDKWRPSIHMPKAACRLFLKVKSVRVERLHEISEEDAIAEGVETLGLYPGYEISAKGKFEGLWNLINGIESWEANPWVFVIEFERINKPEKFN